jgi:4-amino-4-deoxychorismate lyase
VKPSALFNGRSLSSDWALSRALHYGDGIFRTCFIYDSYIIDINKQFEKLNLDLEVLGLSRLSIGECRREALALAKNCNRGALKIMLWRSQETRSYAPTARATDRLLIRYELPPMPAANWRSGVRAIRSPVALAEQPRLAGIKHLNRLEQVLASADWPRGVSEAIQCDTSGYPIGGTRSNLFWVTRDALYTPELTRCGVAGVMREKVLEIAQALGIAWRIGRWRWQDFERSDEAFVTNSLIGIWPLRALGKRRWAKSRPVTHRLMDALAHPGAAA